MHVMISQTMKISKSQTLFSINITEFKEHHNLKCVYKNNCSIVFFFFFKHNNKEKKGGYVVTGTSRI